MAAGSAVRIAVYGQAGAPYHYLSLFARHGYASAAVFAEEVRAGALAAFDVFVIPGGGFDGMPGQIEPLGRRGTRAVSEFVRSGGMYLGSCAGAYDAADPAPGFVRSCPAQPFMRLLPARVWNEDRDRWQRLESPGVGIIRVRNDFPDHPVMAGMPAEFEIVHYNGPIFTHATSLLSVAGSTAAFTPSEEFLSTVGQMIGPAGQMIGQAADAALSVVVAGRCGRGRVVLFGCHPEFGFSLGPMDDEQLPSRMLLNAVGWQSAERKAGPAGGPVTLRSSSAARPDDPRRSVDSVIALIRAEISALRRKPPGREWLSASYAMSVFGRPATFVWDSAITSIIRLVDEIQAIAPGLPPAILNFAPPPQWRVDFGYAGVLPLLARARAMIARANDAWDADLGPATPDPYAFIRTSPYHLVAGSYLAAIGHITGAALLCRCPPERLNA
jgi:hypothetical protein